MLTFASLLLGLTLGVHSVELLAEEKISSVEVILNGATIARLDAPPFRLECDFGPELAPQELVAVGYDANGKEVARTAQWINLPRRPAEITAIFEQRAAPGESVHARLRWASLAGGKPPIARAWFDGAELTVSDPEVIALPSHDPEQLHFFRAELTFPGNVVSSFESTLGGTYSENVKTDLTAIVLSLTRKKEPTLDELESAFSKNGVPLEIVALDKPPAQIVVVRDRSIDEEFAILEARRALGTRPMGRGVGPGFSSPTSRLDRVMVKKLSGWRLEFVWPVAERRQGSAGQMFDLFSHSPEFLPEDGSLYAFLTRVDFPEHLSGPQRLADSLAVAGLSAAAIGARRKAILILGQNPEDSSDLDPGVVRRYLEQIQVPLEIWTTAKKKRSLWGEVERIIPKARLDSEWRELLEDLSRQRVAWVRGSHLPQSIELAPVNGVELIRQ